MFAGILELVNLCNKNTVWKVEFVLSETRIRMVKKSLRELKTGRDLGPDNYPYYGMKFLK